jgi:7-cyano-7-deazaguanine tRNA-ribosyltransferase
MPAPKREFGCFEIHERDLAGRIGLLKTKTAPILTPALFPVVNHVKKSVPIKTISRIGYKQIIANAYLISKHSKRAATRKGIHKLLGFNGAIMTDSGAYQILSHGHVEIEPAEIIRFQEAIDTDIGVILDIPTPSNASYNQAEESVETTIKRAKESVKQRKRNDILWSGPIQGGNHSDLVERSAKAMSKLPFDIYAIGSPTTIMEQYQYSSLVDLIMTAKRYLPLQAPVHLFGAGHPAMFSLAVALGCDLFDSAAYALYARDGRYLTVDGTLHLEDLGDLPCECPICANTTPKDLAGLPELEQERSLAEHNLYVSIREIKQIKQAIRRGTLWELIRMRCASHPKLWEGFLRLTEYADKLEESDPLPGPHQAGITFIGSQDLSRPEVLRHRARLLEEYQPPKGRKVLLLIPETDLRRFGLPKNLEEALGGLNPGDIHVCMISTAFGIIPSEIAQTFPLSQNIVSGLESEHLQKKLCSSIMEYVTKNRKHYGEVMLLKVASQNTDALYTLLHSALKKEKIANRELQLTHITR